MLDLWCVVLHLEAESDLNEAGAEGVHTEPGGTVHVIGGESLVRVLDKAESFEGEASFLLLSVDSHYRLAIPVTPGREQMLFLPLFFFRTTFQ